MADALFKEFYNKEREREGFFYKKTQKQRVRKFNVSDNILEKFQI